MDSMEKNIHLFINDKPENFNVCNLKTTVRNFNAEGRLLISFDHIVMKNDKIVLSIECGEFKSVDSDEDYTFFEFTIKENTIGIGIKSNYPNIEVMNNTNSITVYVINGQQIDFCVTWKNNIADEDLSLWYLSDKNVGI